LDFGVFCKFAILVCRVSKCAETYVEFYQQYHLYDPLVGQQESRLPPFIIHQLMFNYINILDDGMIQRSGGGGWRAIVLKQYGKDFSVFTQKV
jgi:hypothetical protein